MSGRGRVLRALAVGTVASLLTGAAAVSGALDGVERDLVDARFDVRGPQGAPDDVVVVGIDEDSLGLRWPFPRWIHADVIDELRRTGARTIVYDVQFSEPSRPRFDRELVEAAAHDDVLLGTTDRDEDGAPKLIGDGRLRAAHADVPYDGDGAVRRLERAPEGLEHLAVSAAGADPAGPPFWIDYAGPPGTVRHIPFWRAAQGRLDPAVVRDKVVVVGATATSLGDLHPTSAGGQMPGPEIVANAIQTLLDGTPLDDAPPAVGVLLVLAAAFVAPLATLPGPPGRAVVQALAAGALGLAALVVGAQLAFEGGAIVPVAAPVLGLLLGTAGAIALTYGVEVRSRRHTRAAFERFVPPAVVEEILRRGDGSGRLESRRLVATVMFCDLRGFTTLAERLDAEQVIAALNRYLDLVSAAVFDEGGTVVSYQGDGVLAVFGAPIEQPDHAARALAAARRVLDEALPAFNGWLHEAGLAMEDLDVGIGLNTGAVMSGSVGSRRRVEYAAVGDATNVAARLQALGRDRPERLFVSASTYAALGGSADGLRPQGEVRLRGRREPVTVYAAP